MFNITFQQLEVFNAVAEKLNMTEAAKKLYISQSALSKTIGRLESSLGVQLFYRDNRGVTLTPEGKYLHNSLRSPIAAISSAIEYAQSMQLEERTLRICCTSTFLFNTDYDPFRASIESYRRKYPMVDVQESILEWEELQKELVFGSTDVAICQEFAVRMLENVAYERVGTLGLYIIMAENNPLSASETLSTEQLNNEPMYVLSREERSVVEARAMRQCKGLHFEPQSVRTISNMLTLLQVLGSGRGFSIGCKMDSSLTNARMRYYKIDAEKIGADQQYIVVAWNKNNQKTESHRFLNMVRRIRTE